MKVRVWIGLLVLTLFALVGWRYVTKQGELKQLQSSSTGGRTPTVEVETAGPGKLEIGLTGTGSLESPHVVLLSPKSSGRILMLNVREGDAVRAGEPLVRIDPSEAQASLASAEANLAQARARLAQAKIQQSSTSAQVAGQVDQQSAAVKSARSEFESAKANYDSLVAQSNAQLADARSKESNSAAQVRTAEASLEKELATLANAKTNLDRLQHLFDQGFIAAQDLDNAKTAYRVQEGAVNVVRSQLDASRRAHDSSVAQVAAAQAQLAIVERNGKAAITSAQAKFDGAVSSERVAKANLVQDPAYQENLRALSASVSVAEAQVSQAQTAVRETILSSPVSGTVTARNADPGALATPNQTVLVVQNMGSLFLRTSIPVEQSGQIHRGMSVTLKLEPLDKPILGVVDFLNDAADPQSRRVSILVRVENPDGKLKPGMFGTAFFVTTSIQARVAVKKEAISKAHDGSYTVTVIGSDSKAEVRTVTVGTTDGHLVEIKSGVELGEQVVTLTYSKLKDGQIVKLAGKSGAGRGETGAGSAGAGAQPSAKGQEGSMGGTGKGGGEVHQATPSGSSDSGKNQPTPGATR